MAEFKVEPARLTVTGALDAAAARELRDCCRRLVAEPSDAVSVDLTGVDRICGACLGALVALCIGLRDTGRRAVVQPSAAVRRSLDEAGLTATFVAAAKGDAGTKDRSKARKA